MSLHKAIASGKEHRVEYGTKNQPFCKAVDGTCRNHGTCFYCYKSRTHKATRINQETKSKLEEYIERRI